MKKKVTYIISDIDRSVFFEHTALRLKKNFDLSFILINSTDGVLDIFLRANNFVIKRLTVNKISASYLAILKCRKYLKELKPDVVHCHLNSANIVGLMAASLAGIKARIYTRHSGLPLHPSVKERILDTVNNKLAKKIIAPSDNIRKILLFQGVKNEKISVIFHGFDLQRMANPLPSEIERIKQTYNVENKYPVIGVVARWLELKGIQYIIPAFSKFLLSFPNARLCLFNGNENAEFGAPIKKMLSTLDAKSYVIAPYEYNVYDLYQLFDIYIHVPVNNSCEAFGQTYVEALAASVPSIFTLSGIASEFVKDRQNALVVDYKDSSAIYDSLILLMKNKEVREQLAEEGKRSVEDKFSLKNYSQRLKELYLQI